jgi:hypothetical protein
MLFGIGAGQGLLDAGLEIFEQGSEKSDESSDIGPARHRINLLWVWRFHPAFAAIIPRFSA